MMRINALADHLISPGLMLILVFGLFVPVLCYSDSLSLQSFSARARISERTVLGKDAAEDFEDFDVSANFALPWRSYSPSGFSMGTRLMASTGILRGADNNALVVSLIPEFYLNSKDSRFILDIGAGGALFSRHHFGAQDFGGPFQFALTLGISAPLYKKMGIGYRFLHYSDAGVNGSDTTGVDFHMIEFSYRL